TTTPEAFGACCPPHIARRPGFGPRVMRIGADWPTSVGLKPLEADARGALGGCGPQRRGCGPQRRRVRGPATVGAGLNAAGAGLSDASAGFSDGAAAPRARRRPARRR